MTLAKTSKQLVKQNEVFVYSLLRPLLKWAGGKRWLVPYLKPYWDSYNHCRLVELFCGGLAVTIGLLPERALLNDINPYLINFYNQVKHGLTITLSMKNKPEYYYSCRQLFNKLTHNGQGQSKEAAELFYYLNKTGYNGLCRLNSKDEFNVPFGKYKQITYLHDFTSYQQLFTGWEFTIQDFENLKLLPTDFVYADPPYDVPFTQYAKENFSWEDQVRLAKWLGKHSGPVVLSNQATPRIIKLYKSYSFNLQFLSAPRMISCNGNRTPVLEVLATNNSFRYKGNTTQSRKFIVATKD